MHISVKLKNMDRPVSKANKCILYYFFTGSSDNYSSSSSRSNNYTNTSNNWSSNYSYERYSYKDPYSNTNSQTNYKYSNRKTSYEYSHLRPFNVFINVIKVPKNVVKTQVDIMLLTFIKNRTLKLILFQLFQFVWTLVLKNLSFNILIPTSLNNSLDVMVRNILGNITVRVELTELDSLKGKAIRVQVNENEKVLVVNIPRGVKRNQSFYLFYLIDDDNSASFKA